MKNIRIAALAMTLVHSVAFASAPAKLVTATGAEYVLVPNAPAKMGNAYLDPFGVMWGQGVLDKNGQPLKVDYETANAYCGSIEINGIKATLGSAYAFVKVAATLGYQPYSGFAVNLPPDSPLAGYRPDPTPYHTSWIYYDPSKPALNDMNFAGERDVIPNADGTGLVYAPSIQRHLYWQQNYPENGYLGDVARYAYSEDADLKGAEYLGEGMKAPSAKLAFRCIWQGK